MKEVKITGASPLSTPGQLLLERAEPSWASPSSCRGKLRTCPNQLHNAHVTPLNDCHTTITVIYDQLDTHLLTLPLLQASLNFTSFQTNEGCAV